MQPGDNKSKFYGRSDAGERKEGISETLLPELELITDKELKEKTVEAWALGCRSM